MCPGIALGMIAHITGGHQRITLKDAEAFLKNNHKRKSQSCAPACGLIRRPPALGEFNPTPPGEALIINLRCM